MNKKVMILLIMKLISMMKKNKDVIIKMIMDMAEETENKKLEYLQATGRKKINRLKETIDMTK